MTIPGYDKWKTASPYDDEYDPVEMSEKIIKSTQLKLMNWETQPGEWKSVIDELMETIDKLNNWILDNT